MTGQWPELPFHAFGALQRFARRPGPEERCELCGNPVAAQHEHLLEVGKRRLICSCQACAILFSEESGQKYRRVPSQIRALPDFRLTNSQWESLLVPINMAFFVESAGGTILAMFPSPAGATDSQVPVETWAEIVEQNAPLRSMAAGVEALLVNRLGEHRGFPENQYYLLPIDRCFQLVGLVRTHWRGLSGGTELWRELQQYFTALKAASHA